MAKAKRTIYDALFSTKENEKLYYEAGILVEVCEKLYELMEENDFKNKDIARKLGVSASQVSQWLDGTANMQIKTVADILFAMGLKFETFVAEPINKEIEITVEAVSAESKSTWDAPSEQTLLPKITKSKDQLEMAA